MIEGLEREFGGFETPPVGGGKKRTNMKITKTNGIRGVWIPTFEYHHNDIRRTAQYIPRPPTPTARGEGRGETAGRKGAEAGEGRKIKDGSWGPLPVRETMDRPRKKVKSGLTLVGL